MLPLQRAATASWRRETNHTHPIIGVVNMPKKNCNKGRHREHPKLTREGVLLKQHQTRCLLGGGIPRQRRATAATSGKQSSGDFSTHNRDETYTGPSTAARNRSVSSGSKYKQSTSRQYVESSNCSTASHDKI
jgi:hypothetical protein